ncbi:MAG: hypothetical protein WCS73_00350 [Lentisphaeria bacterium]
MIDFKFFKFYTRPYLLIAGVIFFTLLFSPVLILKAQAKEDELLELGDDLLLEDSANKTDDSWKQERDQIFKDIESYIQKVVDKKITNDITAKIITRLILRNENHKTLGNFKLLKGTDWSDTIQKAPKSITNIETEINQQIDKRVETEYPDEKKKEFAIAAKEKYTMYKFKDKVEVHRRGGYGTDTIVKGIYIARNSERIRIGHYYVARLDLSKDDEARFYEAANKKLIDIYQRQQEEIYDAKKEGYRNDLRIQLLPPAFLNGSYVPNPKKDGASIKTSKQEFWIDKYTLLNNIKNYLKTEAKKKLRAIETPKRMAAAKFILAKSKEGKEEWMPQSVADAILKEKQAAEMTKDGTSMQNGLPGDDIPPNMQMPTNPNQTNMQMPTNPNQTNMQMPTNPNQTPPK